MSYWLLVLLLWPLLYSRLLLPACARLSSRRPDPLPPCQSLPGCHLVICARDWHELEKEQTLINIQELFEISELKILIALQEIGNAAHEKQNLHHPLIISTNASKNRSIDIAMKLLEPNEEDFVILSDANTRIPLESLLGFLHWFTQHPHLGAAGAPINYLPIDCPENQHLRNENRIRKWQSTLGCPIGLSGGMMVFKARCYASVPEEFPLDLGLPLALASEGIPVQFASGPTFFEPMPNQNTTARRRRTMSRGIWCVLHFLTLFLQRRQLALFFHLLSHKGLRFLWAFTLPSFCLAIVIENSLSPTWMAFPFLLLVLFHGHPRARHLSEACLGLLLAWFDVLRGRKIRTWPSGH